MGCSLAEPVGRSSRALRLVLFLGLLLGAAALTGCSGCGEPPSNVEFDASGLDSRPECGGALCGGDEVCWRERCTPACSGDDQCVLGERCTGDGFCRVEVPPGQGELCVLDIQCDSRVCEGGSCVPGRDCRNDGDCFEAEICGPLAFCVAACLEAADCPEGELCAAGGCIATTECAGDDACPDGACLDGACERACDPTATSDECGLDVDCNTSGLCVPHCASDDDCAEGVCLYGACEEANDEGDNDRDMGVDVGDDGLDAGDEDGGDRVPDCLTNEDCGDEAIRCEDGLCVPLEICQGDEDCFDDQYCHRGQCRLWCASNLDCRGEQTCVDQRCVDAPEDAACRSTEDCEPCESCIYGLCTVSQFFCRDDEDCGYDKVCRNGFCAYECATGPECPRGQSCIDLVCLDDPPAATECVFNDECAEGSFCINGRCHVACETHSECGYREMCDHGVCQPDRRPGAECLLNTHCTAQVSVAECVDSHCALPCFDDDECRTGACEVGFCTR